MCASAYVTIWASAVEADKAKIVCTGAKLRGAHCVDSALIRALTAEVRRSGVALSFDWTPGNLMEPGGRVVAEGCSAQAGGIFRTNLENCAQVHTNKQTNTYTHYREFSLISAVVKPAVSSSNLCFSIPRAPFFKCKNDHQLAEPIRQIHEYSFYQESLASLYSA